MMARKKTVPAAALIGKRVKLVGVLDGQGTAVEEEELRRRIRREGWAMNPYRSGEVGELVYVRFDDGGLFICTPEELQLCDPQPRRVPQKPVQKCYVQACVANVGFPEDIGGVQRMIDKNDGESDLENLLWPRHDSPYTWTAPRWLTGGDLMFFYHTKRGLQNLRQLSKQLDSPISARSSRTTLRTRDELQQFIHRQEELANSYVASIFACARVCGRAYVDERHPDEHWESRMRAALDTVHVFERPIFDDEFRGCLKLSPGGSLTPLHGDSFAKLKHLISKSNELPTFLAAAEPGGVGFRDVDVTNWRQIACTPKVRFIDESQLRAYLIDYLLEELKDEGTTVYQECRCDRRSEHPCYADYFVRIEGTWFPVEAKLNVAAERDLPGQIARYVGVREFVATIGRSREKVVTGRCAEHCLVIDADGLYVANASGFQGCKSGKPLWSRIELRDVMAAEIRRHVTSLTSNVR